ncbi:hypothetical protein [Pectobacterium brasiliense]|uniref:hypothetical protein n=1 Tax=Pectobacterium brasiliense TaxID=180957 RepID=UPI00068FF95F|nr:hypothetical protein [Pectobacterium brasiliense]UDQ76082.1 hypothetical protein LJQ72_00300 [Pectobacterium brasiliense]
MEKKKYFLINGNLYDILNSNKFGNVKIGSSILDIISSLGEPDSKPEKISRKSKIYNYSYGNVNILVEGDFVVAINIDLHGESNNFIKLEGMDNWNLEDWIKLAKSKSWNIELISDTTNIYGDGISLALSREGKIAMVSIR